MQQLHIGSAEIAFDSKKESKHLIAKFFWPGRLSCKWSSNLRTKVVNRPQSAGFCSSAIDQPLAYICKKNSIININQYIIRYSGNCSTIYMKPAYKQRKVKNKRHIKVTLGYFIASSLGFFMMAWVGIILSPLCLLIIQKILKKSINKNIPYLKWVIWSSIGLLASLIHFIHYPDSFLFYTNSGLNSQNSVNGSINQAVKACTIKKLNGEERPYFKVPKLIGYIFLPKNGSCDGDSQGKIRAVRTDENIIFNWWSLTSYNPFMSRSLPKEISYDINNKVKSCIPGENDHFCAIGRWELIYLASL